MTSRKHHRQLLARIYWVLQPEACPILPEKIKMIVINVAEPDDKLSDYLPFISWLCRLVANKYNCCYRRIIEFDWNINNDK